MKSIYYLLLFTCLPFVLQAQTVDNTFGTNGAFISSLGTTDEEAVDFVIQPDGKAILLGNTDYDPDESSNSRIVVIRLNTNGRLDNTFGTNGVAYIDFPSESNDATSMALQSDGKIVIGGSASRDATIYRLNTNGSLDVTFNGTGKKMLSETISWDFNDVFVQNDGKILASGEGFLDISNTYRGSTIVARFNANGTLDNTFNETGYNNFKISSIAAQEDSDAGQSISVQSDGKIVTCGDMEQSGSSIYYDMYVARLNTNGTLDNTFGTSGKRIFNWTGDQYQPKAKIDANGKIVMLGWGYLNSTNIDKYGTLAIRLLNDGTNDNTFGTSGSSVYDDINNSTVFDISPNGSIYIADDYLSKTRLSRTGNNGKTVANLFEMPFSNSDEPTKIKFYGNNLYLIGTAQPTTNTDNTEIYFVKLTNVLGVTDIEETDLSFNISPNPVTDHLTVNYTEGSIHQIQITGLTGQILLQKDVNDKQADIDVSQLANGLYLLTVETTDGRRGVQKFVKN